MGAARKIVPRSPRLKSQPGIFSNYVTFQKAGKTLTNQGAQFADVSETGMRLISRKLLNVRVGESVNIEFTMPGTEKTIQNEARIVRKSGDFVFAVHFLNLQDDRRHDLQQAILQHTRLARWGLIVRPLEIVADWLKAHRSGLWISALGLIFFGGLGAWIFLSSDEYLGKNIRSWNHSLPAQRDR